MSLADATRLPAPTVAATALRAARRRSLRNAALLTLAATVGVVLSVLTRVEIIIALTAGCLLIASFFGLNAWRAQRVLGHLVEGCIAVFTVGWTRVPDGCNFAVFLPGTDAATAPPECVVRVATVTATGSGPALLVGRARPWRAVGILDRDGDVLAVGRCRATRNGRRVWARRHRPKPRWATGPQHPPPDI